MQDTIFVDKKGKSICKLPMDSMPALDISFEHNKKFYKVTDVRLVSDVDESYEKLQYECTVKSISEDEL